MVNYSIEKLSLIKEYIQTESEDVYYKNLGDRYDIIMIVDWGEFDTDIIEYCEAILQTKQLSVEEIDVENKQGFEIIITYKEKKITIPYQGEGAYRNTTIITLNEIIQPDYEIRWCKISDGNIIWIKNTQKKQINFLKELIKIQIYFKKKLFFVCGVFSCILIFIRNTLKNKRFYI